MTRVLLLVAAACAAAACSRSSAETAPAPAPGTVPVVAMDSTLRAAVVAQRAYRETRGTYARNADELAAAVGFAPSAGVSLVILSADERGWTGRAAFAGRSGRNCVVFDGDVAATRVPVTDQEGRRPTEAGVPACDPAGA